MRLREKRLMERLAKVDASMALLVKWIHQKQRYGRIRAKHAIMMAKVVRIQRAYRAYRSRIQETAVSAKALCL